MFRFVDIPASSTNALTTKPPRPKTKTIADKEVQRLNKDFSTKTLFHNVALNCANEAQQILQTSLTDPNVRQAVTSLRTLRQSIETSNDVTAGDTPGPGYDVGIRLYCTALGGLASKLSSTTIEESEAKSALLCCEMFISIEQSRGNFAAMAQHIIGGLRILHEHRVRPGFSDETALKRKLEPPKWKDLPLVDVFVIKLFSAPCKYVDLATAGVDVKAMLSEPSSKHHPRKLVPNMKSQLTRIGARVIEFLDKVSNIQSEDAASEMLEEKKSLLAALDVWIADTDSVEAQMQPSGTELLSLDFARFLQTILRIVVLSALDSSTELYNRMEAQLNQIQHIATVVTKGVAEFKQRKTDAIKFRG